MLDSIKPLTEAEAKELCESLRWFAAVCRNADDRYGAAQALFNTLSRIGMRNNADRLSKTLRMSLAVLDIVAECDRELQKVREERDALRVEVSSLKTSLMLSRSVVDVKHTYCKNCGDEVILDIGQDTGLCRVCWNARGDE